MSADYLSQFEAECLIRDLKQIDITNFGSSE